MKKVLITILIFLLTATATSYAGIFNQSETKQSNSNPSNSGEETTDNYGGFFRSSSADNPGGRPDDGGGIGQQAPVGNGLYPLVICSLFFGIVKLSSDKRKKIFGKITKKHYK